DASGHYFFTGRSTAYGGRSAVTILKAALATDPAKSLAPGTIQLAADGTLLARGTTGNDEIKVYYRKGKIRVELNRKSANSDPTQVRGLYLQGDGGNDRIELSQSIRGGYLAGGRGRDTLSGSDSWDTLCGGSGNDLLNGRGGADDLAG